MTTQIKQTTTIEQTTGYHSNGTPYVALVTINTDARDLGWDGETDVEWWEGLVADMHTANVALAQLSPDQRRTAVAAMDAANVDTLDLEDQPAAMLRAVAVAAI